MRDVSWKWAHPVPWVFSSYCSEDTHVETFLHKYDFQHQEINANYLEKRYFSENISMHGCLQRPQQAIIHAS